MHEFSGEGNADRKEDRWIIRDDAKVVEMVEEFWRSEGDLGLIETVSTLLRDQQLWGQDLHTIRGLREEIVTFVRQVRNQGVSYTLASLVRTFTMEEK